MPLSRDLEQEHRAIDRGIEAFASGLAATEAPRTAVLADALDELRRHIFLEEALLFPPLQEAGLVPPLVVMRREHGEIWASMDALAECVAPGADPGSLRQVLDRLRAQLDTHNAKEEAVVYPAADHALSAAAQDDLGSQLESLRMPSQWVCEAARR